MEPALARCPSCLRLSLPARGRCVFDDCANPNRSVVEDRAMFLSTIHGYRIKDGAIWLTTHDEPETGWEGTRIGTYSGDYAEAYRLMIAHRFPISVIQCVECHDVDVTELGDMCNGCARETSNWERAGEFV